MRQTVVARLRVCLIEVTDAAPASAQDWRPAPGRGSRPGVVLFTPEEVALLVEAEAE